MGAANENRLETGSVELADSLGSFGCKLGSSDANLPKMQPVLDGILGGALFAFRSARAAYVDFIFVVKYHLFRSF
jgi:hypothetical protein